MFSHFAPVVTKHLADVDAEASIVAEKDEALIFGACAAFLEVCGDAVDSCVRLAGWIADSTASKEDDEIAQEAEPSKPPAEEDQLHVSTGDLCATLKWCQLGSSFTTSHVQAYFVVLHHDVQHAQAFGQVVHMSSAGWSAASVPCPTITLLQFGLTFALSAYCANLSTDHSTNGSTMANAISPVAVSFLCGLACAKVSHVVFMGLLPISVCQRCF
eukprot:TRINITY_DN114841_c0_g1_i1.p1 TRINITY_DN114841_c0_g1~~TRINITY_DN114841_c0_g1_i1.p1  ORF type:complete len:215 (+),score=26.06 TRINITY_DN114841_c0_g1_i1:117-761(+)